MSSTENKEETTNIEFVDLKVLKDQGIKLFCKEKCLLKPSVYCVPRFTLNPRDC
jgi:hypothetical protein